MARDDRDPLLEEFSVRMSVIKWPSGLLLVGRRVAMLIIPFFYSLMKESVSQVCYHDYKSLFIATGLKRLQ